MKLSLMRKRGAPEILGLSGEELPEIFTAINMPSRRYKNKMLIAPGAEKLIYDGRRIAIDLFSGCGGFSLGFINAGFRIVAAVENDVSANLTYVYNIPFLQKAPLHCYNKDIKKLSGREILFNLGLEPGDVDAVIGSPPCQGFSYIGKRKVGDIRDSLLFEFKRLVLEIQPKTWIMENVPGLKTKKLPDGSLVLDKFLEGFKVQKK
ncbi:MAG TPA: DNA cytosine methyltransferase [Candidatus Aminicenantes bacterium]|nr:DNA cytosine methyltransferase [Candidatus Aminicenantes bacterium]